MSLHDAARFLSMLSQNEELARQVQNSAKEEVITIASENDCEMTLDEFKVVVQKVSVLTEKSNDELTDDDLETVVGGFPLIILGITALVAIIKEKFFSD